jgi:mitochondrial import receptor subunit TOM40
MASTPVPNEEVLPPHTFTGVPSEARPKSIFAAIKSNLTYPGKYEDKDREAKEITGNNELFEGMRFDCQRMVSNNFSVTHILSMGGSEGNGAYTFNTNYGTNKVSAIGRYDGEGRVIGRLQYSPYPYFTATAQSQVSLEPAQSNLTVEADYKGEDSHTQVKLENKGVLVLTYMQSLSKRFAAGAELVHVPTQGTFLSLSGRYTTPVAVEDEKPSSIFVGTFLSSVNTASFSYTRHIGKKTDLSTEYSIASTPDGKFQDGWAAGAQWTFRSSRIKARVDHMHHVGVMVEENIAPFMRLSFAADLDHKEEKYKFGLGFSLIL